MQTNPEYIPLEVKLHLSKDKALKPLVDSIQLKAREPQNSVYEALLRSINFQQLSGKSASVIHERFLGLFPHQYPDPNLILEYPDEILKSAGLSRQKLGYIKNVASYFILKDLMKVNWEAKNDLEILDLLTPIKGVGNWTVEMILMFTLKRPDVFTTNDLVINQAVQDIYHLHHLKGKVLKSEMLRIAEKWRPYRTWACRYFWQWKQTLV